MAFVERVDEAFDDDEVFTVVGKKLQVGDLAPIWSFSETDWTEVVKTVSSTEIDGGYMLIFVNALGTPVCESQVRSFWMNLGADDESRVFVVSCQSASLLTGWKIGTDVKIRLLSAKSHTTQLKESFGVWLKEPELPQRSVFVIDTEGKIRFAGYVKDQGGQEEADQMMKKAFAVYQEIFY